MKPEPIVSALAGSVKASMEHRALIELLGRLISVSVYTVQRRAGPKGRLSVRIAHSSHHDTEEVEDQAGDDESHIAKYNDYHPKESTYDMSLIDLARSGND